MNGKIVIKTLFHCLMEMLKYVFVIILFIASIIFFAMHTEIIVFIIWIVIALLIIFSLICIIGDSISCIYVDTLKKESSKLEDKTYIVDYTVTYEYSKIVRAKDKKLITYDSIGHIDNESNGENGQMKIKKIKLLDKY